MCCFKLSKKAYKRRLKNDYGFSLVELIIVIVIIAIIIALLAPQFIKQIEKSKEARDLQDIDEYKVVVENMVLDDKLSSGEIYIEVDPENGGITSNIPDTALVKYGVDSSIDLSSNQWKPFKWTYDTTDYIWKLEGEDLSGAQYFTPLGKVKNNETGE